MKKNPAPNAPKLKATSHEAKKRKLYGHETKPVRIIYQGESRIIKDKRK